MSINDHYHLRDGQVIHESGEEMNAATMLAVVGELRQFLLDQGYRSCDSPACNCGSYHLVHGYPERMAELREVLDPANGETLLAAAKRMKLAMGDPNNGETLAAARRMRLAMGDPMYNIKPTSDEAIALLEAFREPIPYPGFNLATILGLIARVRHEQTMVTSLKAAGHALNVAAAIHLVDDEYSCEAVGGIVRRHDDPAG